MSWIFRWLVFAQVQRNSLITTPVGKLKEIEIQDSHKANQIRAIFPDPQVENYLALLTKPRDFHIPGFPWAIFRKRCMVNIFRCDSISRNTLYTGHSLTHSLTHLLTLSQSWCHLLGQVSRPFRQSKDVKKGNIAIIAIPAIMTIRVRMTIAAIMAITDIRAITASTGIRANCHQYHCYCQ